ncbi:MAG: hypothetical protein ACREM6_16240, partial [Vulcanimicrobiaceae bacterium]
MDNFDGTFSVSRQFNPEPARVILETGPIGSAMDDAWSRSESTTHDQIMSGLTKFRFDGQNLYDITVSLPSSGELRAKDLGGNRVGLKYVLTGNSIQATSTQPTVAGSWADPNFKITYDASVYISFSSPRATAALNLDSASLTISNVNVEPEGVIADLAYFVLAIQTNMTSKINTLAAQALQNQAGDIDIAKTFKGYVTPFLVFADATLKDSAKAGYAVTTFSVNPNAVALLSINSDILQQHVKLTPATQKPLLPPVIQQHVKLPPQPLPTATPKPQLPPGIQIQQQHVKLNPQPLPPATQIQHVELNPQPLPPGAQMQRQQVKLNPQPLPPGTSFPTSIRAAKAFSQSNYTEAAAEYRADVARHPDDAVAHYNLGYSYLKLGRAAEGRAELQ